MSLLTSDPIEAEHGLTTFDATTELRPTSSRGDRFEVELDPSWSSLVGIHGGYLAAIAIKAAERVAARPIRTVTTTFLRPGSIGAATVDVEVVRRGRSITNLTVTLSQSSKTVLISQVVAAEVVESTSWERFTPPDLSDFAECVPITPPEGIRHFDHARAVLDPRTIPFTHGPVARVAGFVQPSQPRPIDAAWLGMALDWFPPAAFTRIDPPAGGISITYTVHIHGTHEGLAADEWLGGEFDVDVSADGIALEKGRITDPTGRVLAESFHTRLTAGPNQLGR